MPDMRQRASDSHSEDRAEGRTAVLGMFAVPEVQNDAELIDARDSKESEPVSKYSPLPVENEPCNKNKLY